jgi:hypothetical protein
MHPLDCRIGVSIKIMQRYTLESLVNQSILETEKTS